MDIDPRRGSVAAMILLVAACAAEAPQPPVRRARIEPARSAEVSPAVKALLEDDPDLQAGMSPEEVRAALQAAKQHEAFPAATSPTDPELPRGTAGRDSDEWKGLEQKQKAQLDAHRKRLESTTVVAGPDGAYHASGCEVLYQHIVLKDGTLQRIYLGRSVTLAHASQSGMSRHAACGAPSAEFTYQ